MLEGFPDRPKGMHWETYDRLRHTHDIAEARSMMGLMGLTRLGPKYSTTGWALAGLYGACLGTSPGSRRRRLKRLCEFFERKQLFRGLAHRNVYH
jgi:hypothetical protein